MAKLKYIESNIPQDMQDHKGWFWFYPEKVFYRWSDHILKCKQYDEKEEESGNRTID